MFVDACAIVAILSEEPDAAAYGDALDRAMNPFTSPLAAFEAVLVLARPDKFDCDLPTAQAVVLGFLDGREIALRLPADGRGLLAAAVGVAAEHGVGRRKLSTFDCLHYACAKLTGETLLTLDRMLRNTDIETVPSVPPAG